MYIVVSRNPIFEALQTGLEIKAASVSKWLRSPRQKWDVLFFWSDFQNTKFFIVNDFREQSISVSKKKSVVTQRRGCYDTLQL